VVDHGAPLLPPDSDQRGRTRELQTISTAYDSDALRRFLSWRGTQPVIPTTRLCRLQAAQSH
jgi:hypothetical protein